MTPFFVHQSRDMSVSQRARSAVQSSGIDASMSPRYRDEKIVRSAERPGTIASPFTDLYIWVCFCWIRGTEVHAMTPCTTERSTMTLPGVADKGIYKADASLVMNLAQVAPYM